MIDEKEKPLDHFGSDLSESVYLQLKKIAYRLMMSETVAQTLQPTDLVHNALLRLRGYRPPGESDRRALVRIGAVVMHRLLVEHARRRRRRMKSGTVLDIMVDSIESRYGDPMKLDFLLTELKKVDPRAAEIAVARVFLSATYLEIAEAIGLSERHVKRLAAKAKLHLSGIEL